MSQISLLTCWHPRIAKATALVAIHSMSKWATRLHLRCIIPGLIMVGRIHPLDASIFALDVHYSFVFMGAELGGNVSCRSNSVMSCSRMIFVPSFDSKACRT